MDESCSNIMHKKFVISCKPKEENLIRKFCNKHRLPISTFFIQAAFEKMEKAKNEVAP